MDKARWAEVELWYNDTSGIAGRLISLSYTDNGAGESDTIELTLENQDDIWTGSWRPQKGDTIRANIVGHNWEKQGQDKLLECGKFVLDEFSIDTWPSTITLQGLSKPANTDFSTRDRGDTWTNTSLKRIGESIAARYGLEFHFDGMDVEIDCREQSGPDGEFYSELCKDYGFIVKAYCESLWVWERERYKSKAAVKNFLPADHKPGSLSYRQSLTEKYTGGSFRYTDADKDCDILCDVGDESGKVLFLNQRASGVFDASLQLCAAVNEANHGRISMEFATIGEFDVSASNNVRLIGFGSLDGKYFAETVTHTIDRSGGFTTRFSCKGIRDAFWYWEVGGSIEYNQQDEEQSTETYAASEAASAAAGAEAGAAVSLDNAPFYYTSTASSPSCYKSGTYYFYDGILVSGRYRMTNLASRCGKQPVGQNVTGWVPAEYCGG